MVAASISEFRKNIIDYLDYVWSVDGEVVIFNEKRKKLLVKVSRLRESKTKRSYLVKKV